MAVRLIVNYDYSELLVLITQYPLNPIPSQFNILPVFASPGSHQSRTHCVTSGDHYQDQDYQQPT